MSTSMSFQSWSQVYQALRAKAEASRGTVTLSKADGPNATFPNTTTDDTFVLSAVFDVAVHDHAAGAVVSRWITETDLLAGEPDECLGPYVGNRSFWETLAITVIELDRVHAPPPERALIEDAMKQLEAAPPAPAERVRNAAGGATLVTEFAELSWKRWHCGSSSSSARSVATAPAATPACRPRPRRATPT